MDGDRPVATIVIASAVADVGAVAAHTSTGVDLAVELYVVAQAHQRVADRGGHVLLESLRNAPLGAVTNDLSTGRVGGSGVIDQRRQGLDIIPGADGGGTPAGEPARAGRQQFGAMMRTQTNDRLPAPGNDSTFTLIPF